MGILLPLLLHPHLPGLRSYHVDAVSSNLGGNGEIHHERSGALVELVCRGIITDVLADSEEGVWKQGTGKKQYIELRYTSWNPI